MEKKEFVQEIKTVESSVPSPKPAPDFGELAGFMALNVLQKIKNGSPLEPAEFKLIEKFVHSALREKPILPVIPESILDHMKASRDTCRIQLVRNMPVVYALPSPGVFDMILLSRIPGMNPDSKDNQVHVLTDCTELGQVWINHKFTPLPDSNKLDAVRYWNFDDNIDHVQDLVSELFPARPDPKTLQRYMTRFKKKVKSVLLQMLRNREVLRAWNYQHIPGIFHAFNDGGDEDGLIVTWAFLEKQMDRYVQVRLLVSLLIIFLIIFRIGFQKRCANILSKHATPIKRLPLYI